MQIILPKLYAFWLDTAQNKKPTAGSRLLTNKIKTLNLWLLRVGIAYVHSLRRHCCFDCRLCCLFFSFGDSIQRILCLHVWWNPGFHLCAAAATHHGFVTVTCKAGDWNNWKNDPWNYLTHVCPFKELLFWKARILKQLALGKNLIRHIVLKLSQKILN